jgi:hypothetical protein
MGIDEWTDDNDSNDSTDDTSDSDSSIAEQSTDDAYEAYANLDDELNPEVAAIVDEVIEEWNNDRMVDAYIDEDYVRVRRGELVYGIVNIVKRTQMYFDEQ